MSFVTNALLKLMPERKLDIFGKDGLLKTSLPYYSFFGLMIFVYLTFFTQPWFSVALIYAMLPFLDDVFTRDYRNPSEAERKELQKNDQYFKFCLYVAIAVDWFIFVEVLKYMDTYSLETDGIFKLLGFLYVYSNINATHFTVSHEIFHKPGNFNRILGTLHMSKNLYTHFTYEHVYGHHRKVATPEDPASAPQHISVYQFVPKSVVGSWKSVYNMQKEEGKSVFLNYAVLSLVWSFVFTTLVYLGFGSKATLFFVAQALLSIFFLEVINYVEHYGLRRKRLEDGTYEKVTIRHSWNAPHRFTNYILFKLQRHSDHHENAMKPYQTLLSLNESPQLPHGYSLMVSMSLIPSVWFRIMDPLVEEYKRVGSGDIKSEVAEKAIEESKKFAVETGLAAMALWGLNLLLC